MKLLSVDWDFFFKTPWRMKAGERKDQHLDLYDWGHRDNAFFAEFLWPTRAGGFVRNGLPLPGTSGEEVGFWDRFRFAPRTKLYLADSHSLAIHPRVAGRSPQRYVAAHVWNYDAHHDCGYHKGQAKEAAEQGRYACDDWMVGYHALAGELHVRYPRWATAGIEAEPKPEIAVDRRFDDGDTPRDGADRPVVFDTIFLCRSASWAPPWIDPQFKTLLDTCPVPNSRRVVLQDDIPGGWPCREWDEEALKAGWEAERVAIEEARASLAERKAVR